jgi:hypothetical protein
MSSTLSGQMPVDFASSHDKVKPQEHILENKYVWTVDNILTDEECDKLIDISEGHYDVAPITLSDNTAQLNLDTRNNERVIWDDIVTAEELWRRIEPYVPKVATDLKGMGTHASDYKAVGLNERFRFYKYLPEQFFAPHYDGCFKRNDVTQSSNLIFEKSYLTIIFYLNTVKKGGETNFLNAGFRGNHEKRFSVSPKRGSACLFVHSQLHEGASIPQGSTEVKYVLRSDVMYRKVVQNKNLNK